MARVYVSSTLSDLKTERQVVIDWLVSAGHTPVHSYRADTEAVAISCLKDVDSCDYYVLILGHRYGFRPSDINPDNLSITHLEFRRAARIPRIALIRTSIPDIRLTDLRDPEIAPLLMRFEEEVRTSVRAAEFSDNQGLIQALSTSIPPEIGRPRKPDSDMRLASMLIDHRSFLEDRLSRFVGREQELSHLIGIIEEKRRTGGYITITGAAGQGKSSIISKLADLLSPDDPIIHIIPFNPGPDYQVNLLRDVMARMILKHSLSEIYVSSETRTILRQQFPHLLKDLAARGATETIFIDGLDQIQEEERGGRDLSFLPLKLPQGIVCVIGTRPNDTLRPLELLQPHSEYKLPNLSEADFILLLRRHGVELSPEDVRRFYRGMQAHALYLDLVSRELALASSESVAELFTRLPANPDSVFSLSISRLSQARDQWITIIRPLLGVLASAREPLGVPALSDIIGAEGHDVHEGLLRLGGLVNQDTNLRYQLFHLKFYDFLRAEPKDSRVPAVFDPRDMAKWHRKIVRWCLPDTNALQASWTEPVRDPVERERRSYALEHLVSHCYHANEWEYLWKILDSVEYAHGKLRSDPSGRTLARDLDWGRRELQNEGRSVQQRSNNIARLWKYSLTRASLTGRIRDYPEQIYSLLVVRGRYPSALEILEEIDDPSVQSRGLIRVGQALSYIEPHREDIVLILLRGRDTALRIRDSWEQADALLTSSRELAASRQWTEAVATAWHIGSASRKLLALHAVLEAMASAGEKELFQRHFHVVHTQAQLTGLRWEGKQSADAMAAIFSEPHRAREILTGIDPRTATISAAKALVSEDAEWVLKHLSRCLDSSATRPLRQAYSAIVCEICKRRPDLNRYVVWDVLNKMSDSSVEDLIERSLLLCLGPLRATGDSLLSESLRRTPIVSDSVARAHALVAFDEDVRDLLGPSRQDTASSHLLKEATQIARAVQSTSARHQLLRMIAASYISIGMKETGAKIEVEAGGGPLVVRYDQDLQTAIVGAEREGDVNRAFALRRSDAYFEQALDKRDWDAALASIRESELSSADREALARLSSKAKIRRLSENDDIALKNLERIRQRAEDETATRAVRTAHLVRRMLADGERRDVPKLLVEAIAYAERVAGVDERVRAFLEVFQAAVAAKAQNHAEKCEQQLLAISRQKPIIAHRAGVLGTLIDGLIRLGLEARARGLANTDLTEAVAAAGTPQDKSATLRVLSKSLWRLKDFETCIGLIYKSWQNAESNEELLGLLPLASILATFDAAQLSDIATSVQESQSLRLGLD